MGLALSVGILADLDVHDAEGAAGFREYFASLNRYLAKSGRPPHSEPSECETWSASMYGYSGLHCLRRLAAHLAHGRSLPSPGDSDSSEDECLQAYYLAATGSPPAFWKRLFKSGPRIARTFDHLIIHSDAEGFYLPQDFAVVHSVPDAFGIPGQYVGSVPRLLAELDQIAAALSIPDHLEADSDEVCEAADNQGHGDTLWERYGVETLSCVALREGCRQSLATGAALVFT